VSAHPGILDGDPLASPPRPLVPEVVDGPERLWHYIENDDSESLIRSLHSRYG
jgi:hypothetical protein